MVKGSIWQDNSADRRNRRGLQSVVLYLEGHVVAADGTLAQGKRELLHHQNLAGEGEPYAGALWLGGEKGNEDFACHIVWDDVAVIADLQLEEGRRGALSG